MAGQDINVAQLVARLQQQLGDSCSPTALQAAFAGLLRDYGQSAALPPVDLPLRPPAAPASTSPPLPAASVSPLTPATHAASHHGSSFSLLQGIIEHLPVALSWFDTDLTMLACNQACRQLLDLPPQLFNAGLPNYIDFVRFNAGRGEYGPGDTEELTQQMVQRALQQDAYVFQRVRPNGTVLEVRGMRLPDQSLLLMFSDITAHKKAEHAALRSETYLRAVIAQLPQGLTVIDENLQIVLWNRMWESVCGATPGFLYEGVSFAEAVRNLAENGEYGGGTPEQIDEQVNMRIGLARQFVAHKFRRTRPNGRVVEIEGLPLSVEGEVAGFITLYNDITERLTIDDLKQAKEAAEAANRMKSEFLALMSHEIRTPLAGVIGMLKLAQRDAGLNPETRQLIMRGEDSAQSLLTIINDLLDFSKIEAGKLTLENIDFDLHQLLEDVQTMFVAQAAGRALALRLECGDDVPHYVLGDPVRLRQILVNLLGNALKFTERGSVTIRATLLERKFGVSTLRFAVRDTGIGIAPEACARVFEKFEQADNTTTRRFGGTGLGLAICRQLCELMGGSIALDSKLGEGSEFYFNLPLPDGVAPQREAAADGQLQPHSHRLRVLAADDFATNQIIIRMLVEGMAHTIEVVDSGEAAVAAAARQDFDVILMDGRMPGMDGVSACRLIRAGGTPQAPVRDKDICIIAVTANVSEQDRTYYMQAGMDSFLSKPVEETKLHRQLEKVIERQLARGIALPSRTEALRAELDAMFGCLNNRPAPEPVQEVRAESEELRIERMIKMQMHDAFVQDVQEKLAQIEQARQDLRADDCGRLLHSMRGSALYLDDTEPLRQLLQRMEPLADKAQWPEVDALLPQLRQLVAACSGEVLALHGGAP